MELLRELLELSVHDLSGQGIHDDKYTQQNEGVDNIVNYGPDYIPMPKPDVKKKKGKKKPFPTTDKAQNSLINTIWFYNNSDAV